MTTQIDKIKNILIKDGHITHVVAQHYNIGCVRKAISTLRALGMTITTERKKDAEGKAYTSWNLVDSIRYR